MSRHLLPIGLALILLIVTGIADLHAFQGERPGSEPTEVEFGILLLDVETIDDTSQSLQANIFFRARWSDSRLAHAGPGTVVYDIDEVWSPRLQIVNRRQTSSTLPQIVEVSPEGRVTYRQRVVGSFSQRLDLTDYPRDRQSFEIQVVAVGYGSDEIQFVPSPDATDLAAAELTIQDRSITEVEALVKPYQPTRELPANAGFALRFEATRHLGYFVSKLILPLIFVVGMSLMVLWIDPEIANPRVGVPVTAMLTVIAYRFMVVNMVPKISYLTRLDLFILASTVLVFLTLVESAWSVMAARRGATERAVAVDKVARMAFPVAYLAAFFWAFFV